MIEKTNGYLPAFPVSRKLSVDSRGTESDLYDLWSAHGGISHLRSEFAADLTVAEEQLKSGELGPLGLTKLKATLAADYSAKLEKYRPAVERARKRAEGLKAELTARSVPESKNADEAVRRAFAEHRAISRFEQLSLDKRRAAIRIALEKKDHNFLSTVLGEPGLIDDQSARRIEVELMKNADRVKFSELQELNGSFDYAGNPDPLTGALSVTSFALDSTLEWLQEQAGTAPNFQQRVEQQATEKRAEQGE